MSKLKEPPTCWKSPREAVNWVWLNRPSKESREQTLLDLIETNVRGREHGFAKELIDLYPNFDDELWPEDLSKTGCSVYRELYTAQSSETKFDPDSEDPQATAFEALWVLAYYGHIGSITDLQDNRDGWLYLSIRLRCWAEEYLLSGGEDFVDDLLKHWEDDLLPNMPNEQVYDWAAIDKLDARRRANIKRLKKA
jgi:hypothetical protein